MRLRQRPRYDTLQNEIRARGRSWGRWVYLGLLAGLVIWAADMFVGNLIYFRAEGLVMRDRVVLATQYPAEVAKLNVTEGSRVAKGQVVAQVRSQRVEETLAQLYSDMAQSLSRVTELEVRSKVYQAVFPMVERRSNEARAARVKSEVLSYQSLMTTDRRAQLIKNEIDSAQEETQMTAEQATIAKNLPELIDAVSASRDAVSRLKANYADGVIRAPEDGVVGYLHVSNGSVIQPGEEMMELFTGNPYILAYVPDGALYTLKPGDRVNIHIGFDAYSGFVGQIFPVAGQLPKEFQNTFQPVARAQIVRIELDPGQREPVLFSKTRLTSADWLPSWLTRLFDRASTPAVTASSGDSYQSTEAAPRGPRVATAGS